MNYYDKHQSVMATMSRSLFYQMLENHDINPCAPTCEGIQYWKFCNYPGIFTFYGKKHVIFLGFHSRIESDDIDILCTHLEINFIN